MNARHCPPISTNLSVETVSDQAARGTRYLLVTQIRGECNKKILVLVAAGNGFLPPCLS